MTAVIELSSYRLKLHILDTLRVPTDATWYLAYSGGLDSTVLLHCLARVAGDAGVALVALHADHGLSPQGPVWRSHCVRQCRDWGIACRDAALTLAYGDKRGPEGRARDARYRWFRDVTGGDGYLFTAHHRRDQAETVVERLARGSGPRGLRGMQPVSGLYGMTVVRPLLDFPREAVRAYADQHRLDWITDESNRDTTLTRNYIRREVLPVLARRWPDIEIALARTAAAAADAETILHQTAESDLGRLNESPDRGDRSLDIPSLQSLGPPRQRNVLRHWIHRERGVTPGYRSLERIVQAINRYPGRSGGMTWPPIDLRIYRDRLYLLDPRDPPNETVFWNLRSRLLLGRTTTLRARDVVGSGLKAEAVKAGVSVSFRQGGEKCRLPGRPHHHTLKHILQEAGVPPWQRPHIPLIRINGDIAAIAGLVYCEPYAADRGENGIEIDVIHEGRAIN